MAKNSHVELLSPAAMAVACGVSASTIRRLEKDGLSPLRQRVGARLYRAYLQSDIPKARGLTRRLRRRNKAKGDV